MVIKPTIIVHGGASNLPDELVTPYYDGVLSAVKMGADALKSGESALDAVETAVRYMEDNATFNAGRGSHPADNGIIEQDAIIMDGRTLNMGACAVVPNIRHAITLARHIMEHSSHCFLAGEGALEYAREAGLEIVDNEWLIVEEKIERYRRLMAMENAHDNNKGTGDTVGAVAIDKDGNLASATSTGGTFGKIAGRVGDSALPGCGATAENGVCAVSTTGWGESIMRVRMAEYAAFAIIRGMSPQEACEKAIERLSVIERGRGGLILLSHNGDYAWAFNTTRMARAIIIDDKKPTVMVD
ncbi:MAG TPA: hypothetical protein ENI43_03095 [Firmicutes bacterium]|nr:hypothetical protein [Bacillota bacterium]